MPTQVSRTVALPRAGWPAAAGKSIATAAAKTLFGIRWFSEILADAYIEARTMSRAAHKRYPFMDW